MNVSVKQNTKSRSANKKWLWILFATPIALLVGAMWWLFGPGVAVGEQRKMETYLENKYDESFSVGWPKYMNGGVGVEGVWKSQTRPQSDSELTFEVNSNSHGFSDQYMAAIWGKKAGRELEQILTERNKNTADKLRGDVKLILSGDLVESANKNTSYENARSSGKGLTYSLKIDNDNPTANTVSTLQYLTNALLERGYKLSSIQIEYEFLKEGNKLTCKAYNLPSSFDDSFVEKCLNSKTGWYNNGSN